MPPATIQAYLGKCLDEALDKARDLSLVNGRACAFELVTLIYTL